MNGLSVDAEDGLDDRPSGLRETFHAAVKLLIADFRKSLILTRSSALSDYKSCHIQWFRAMVGNGE